MTDKLREAIKWAEGQADKWAHPDRNGGSSYMVDNYTLLANAAKATLPPIWLIELSFPKGYTEYRETSLGCAVERARAGLEDGASTVLIKLSR